MPGFVLVQRIEFSSENRVKAKFEPKFLKNVACDENIPVSALSGAQKEKDGQHPRRPEEVDKWTWG